MSNEQKDPQLEKSSNKIGLWLSIGAGVGILFGVVFDNIAMGVIIGAALGLVFGAAFSQNNKKG